MISKAPFFFKKFSVFNSVIHYRLCKHHGFLHIAKCSTLCQNQAESVVVDKEEPTLPLGSPAELLMKWGCSPSDLHVIFTRRPSLRRADIKCLDAKLGVLKGLGISGSDLVKMIYCRPRLLGYKIHHSFDERLEYLLSLFGSKDVLARAVVRNPSLLTYNINSKMKPTIEVYERLGVSKEHLVSCLLTRPTIVQRTRFDDEKIEFIGRTGVTKESKLYKFVVTIIGVSRIETIRAKMENLEKYGFSEDEILRLFGLSPFIMTFSMDKIQRHMTFVLGTMKLPASVALEHPHLLYSSLETVMKPRVALSEKIEEMGLTPHLRVPLLFKALRMTEERFVKRYIMCHPMEVAKELYEYYKHVKGVPRLAKASKKTVCKGFPF